MGKHYTVIYLNHLSITIAVEQKYATRTQNISELCKDADQDERLDSSQPPAVQQLFLPQVFMERRNLLAKWFDKWSDSQRKAVLEDFLSRCSVGQLRYLDHSVSSRLPQEAADFTCLLPRVLSLYLFSFLDPRSLCRCAQVSWHWKAIVELDQLWMSKCLRLGWCISFSPAPFEQGVWKRHYIEMVQELWINKPQTPSAKQQFVVPEVTAISTTRPEAAEPASRSEVRSAPTTHRGRSTPGRGLGAGTGKPPTGLPPWRDADRHPKDTLRFNYLANMDPMEQAQQMRSRYAAPTTTTNGADPDNPRKKPLSEANYKLRKAKSLMTLSLDLSSRLSPPPPSHPPLHHHQHYHNQSRPDWATRSLDYPMTKDTARSLVRSAQWNAGIRPGPVRSAVPRLSVEGLRASLRSHRTAPSTPLFEGQSWTLPASSNQGTDEE